MPKHLKRDAKYCGKECRVLVHEERVQATGKAVHAELVRLQRDRDGHSRRGAPPKIDPVITEMICRAVINGWEPRVAAEAAGISAETYRNWIKKGSTAKKGSYRDFFLAVTKSAALARGQAASTVYLTEPRQWLRHVHRDRPGEPGWSDTPIGAGHAGGEGRGAIVELVRALREAK